MPGCSKTLIQYSVKIDLFSPFYWAGFVAQRERTQQDFKGPLQGAPPHPPPIYI